MEIVDQYYWLGYAKRAVDETPNKLTDAAAKISNLVAIFWGAYTTVFTIGITVKKLNESNSIIFLLILPIPLLIFSYMSALWAQMPELSLKGINPQAPADIKEYYNKIIKNKIIRLWIALVIFLLAGLSLTFALVFANFTHEKGDKKQVVLITTATRKIMLAGDIPDKTLVSWVINTPKGIFSKNSTTVVQDGHFDRTIEAPAQTDYEVNVNWKDAADTSVRLYINKKFTFNKEPAKHP